MQGHLLNNYFTRLYITQPQTIRFTLTKEKETPGALPDFAYLTVLFHTARWDPLLGTTIGSNRRVSILKRTYDKLTNSLMPAIETVLAGAVDAAVPLNFSTLSQATQRFVLARWRKFASLAAWVLHGLLDILLQAMTRCHSSEDVLSDYNTVLQIVERIFEASRVPEDPACQKVVESVYRDSKDSDAIGEFFAVFEHRRRICLALDILQNQIAAMHDGSSMPQDGREHTAAVSSLPLPPLEQATWRIPMQSSAFPDDDTLLLLHRKASPQEGITCRSSCCVGGTTPL
jgi:hypothetical protein